MKNNLPFYNRLQFRVTVLLITVVLCIEVVIGLSVNNLARNNFRHVMSDSFQSTITMTENFIDLVGKKGAASANFIVEAHPINSVLLSSDDQTNHDLFNHIKQESTADIVILLNHKGQIILHSEGSELINESLLEWHIVNKTIADKKPMVSVVQDLKNLIIYSSQPVFAKDTGDTNGLILVGHAINDALISSMKKDTLTDVTFIRRRGVMASTFNTSEDRMIDIPINYMTYQSLLAKGLDNFGEIKMSIKGIEYFVYARKLTKMDPAMEGSILLSYPSSELEIILNDMTRGFTIISLVSLLIIIFISWYFSVRLLSPLRQLIDKTEKLDTQKDNPIVSITNSSEIGLLSQRFNVLLHEIHNKNLELNSHNEMLEEAVTVRTHELQESNNELVKRDNNLLNAQRIANLGSWEWDQENNIISASPEFYNIVGTRNGVNFLTQTEFFKLIHHDDQQNAEKFFLEGKKGELEIRICREDGNIRDVSVELEKFHTDTIKTTFIATIIDITEHKQIVENQQALQQQILQAQKMESISQLTGGIAHDFNNLLAAIIGYTDLSIEKLRQNNHKKIDSYLEKIHKSSIKASELVKQINSFSQNTDDIDKQTALLPLLEDSLNILNIELPEDIEIELNVSDKNHQIITEQVQFHQMFRNLFLNALDAMNGKGTMNINIDLLHNATNRCQSCHETFAGNFIRLTVTDTGTGIKPELLPRIFDPYYTTKNMDSIKGTGLGLASVHGIIHAHEGHIIVESKIDRGTSISLLFPEV